MAFVDAFVATVPSSEKARYQAHAKLAGAVFKECGALRVVDCWANDVPDGKLTSFPLAVKKEAGETVVFGWIEWPSKAVRDEGFPKVIADKRLANSQPPFDGKRMIFGGFDAIAES